MDTIAGEAFIDTCDQKRSNQHVPDTARLRIFEDLQKKKTVDKREYLLKIQGMQQQINTRPLKFTVKIQLDKTAFI
jgi:hypothetical protein